MLDDQVPPYIDSSDSQYDPEVSNFSSPATCEHQQEPLAQELSRVARHLDENFTLVRRDVSLRS